MPRGGARHWIVDCGENLDDGHLDLDALAAEIASEIAAAVRADRQDVWVPSIQPSHVYS
jgi:hypothetical protein